MTTWPQRSTGRRIYAQPCLWIAISLCFNNIAWGISATTGELKKRDAWVEAKFEGKSPQRVTDFEEKPETVATAQVFVLANYEEVQKNAHHGQPLRLSGKEYPRGLFCHAHSKLVVMLPEAARSFTALVGVDDAAGQGSVVFSVKANNKVKFLSEVLRGGGKPVAVDVNLAGAKEFVIEASDGGDGISFDHADWVNAKVTMTDGREIWLADMEFLKGEPAETAGLPFSFVYDGRSFADLISRFKLGRSCRSLDSTRQQYIQNYTDTATGLEVRCEGIKYHDFPTVEWVVYFKNTGLKNSPILERIQALNLDLPCKTQDTFILTDYQGGMSNAEDYHPTRTVLTPNGEKSYVTLGGFPTASNLPFFNLEREERGLIIGLGWPGMWAGKIKQNQGQTLNISFGQEWTHLSLHPGEEIRTPLIVLQFCRGNDRERFQNVWRRWMMAHNMPRPGGNPPGPILTASSSRQYGEMLGANEENQKMFIDRYLEEGIPLDYWWMDAGWYPNKGNDWQDLLGTWEVDKSRFPNGLRAISDYAHRKGIKAILWFEPERVVRDSWLFLNHPKWLLGDGESRFFNHGNPQANEWLTERVSRILNEEGIDLYRQDFAVWARPFWEREDQENPDRQGMAEIKHVVGYLKYMDALQREHPDMLIDICAAGGKRLELENLRRAVPLWRSDYVFEPAGQQGHTIGIAQWIPYYGTTFNQFDAYTFRSCMCPHMSAAYDMRKKNQDFESVRKYIEQWREVSPNYYGDFYPLTPHSLNNGMWIGWQFNRPELGTGMVQMFCRPGTMYDSGKCRLRGLEPEASYLFTDFDTKQTVALTGKEVVENGLRITFQHQPGAILISYRKR